MNPGKQDSKGRTLRERVHAMLGKVPRKAIGTRLGISETAVKHHIQELRRMGLIPPATRGGPPGRAQATNGAPWTDAEDAIITHGMDTLPVDGRIAALTALLPGRTPKAVMTRARTLRPPEARLPGVLRPWPAWARFGVTRAVREFRKKLMHGSAAP